MRKVIVTEFVTLDGVMEAPGGEEGHPHTGWVADYFADDIGELKLGEMLDADHLLGRVTFDSFEEAWPERDGPMAERISAMTKYVTSNTRSSSSWANCVFLPGNPATAVAELKAGTGPDLLVAGSRTLVGALMAADLIDELRLLVFPVTVGSGGRLFPKSPDKIAYTLADTRVFSGGVQLNVYVR